MGAAEVSALEQAIRWVVAEQQQCTVMRIRDELREWTVADTIYTFPHPRGGHQVFCIQDVSPDFWNALLRVVADPSIEVWCDHHELAERDPLIYHDIPCRSGAVRYCPVVICAQGGPVKPI